MRRFLLTALPLAGIALAGSAPLVTASAQMISSREGIALENQILALKQQLNAVQQGGNGGSVLAAPQQGATATSGSNGLVPHLLQQVQTLSDQVQDLRGRVDTLEHEVATQHDEINQELGNLKFQLNQGGKTGNQPAAASAGGPPADLRNEAPPPPSPPLRTNADTHHATHVEASLTAARRALAARQYAAAEADARAVIAHQGKRAGDGTAEFTLAEALSHMGKHQGAAIAYDDAYNANRRGRHAPDALLGLANSLTSIHQNQEACDTLDSLVSQFSSPSASLAAQIHQARTRAHCG